MTTIQHKYKTTKIGITNSRKIRIESTNLQGYGTKSEKNWEMRVHNGPKRKSYRNTKLEATKAESCHTKEKIE